MKVLLIFNNTGKAAEGMRVMVNVQTKAIKEQVISLLEQNKEREAFDLLVKEAAVEGEIYFSPNTKVDVISSVILNEALI